MKQIKQILSFTLAILIVLPVITFAAVPIYESFTKKDIAFEAMNYSGPADLPITVAEKEIDEDQAEPVVISSLTLVTLPTKLIYNWNETINLEGVMLTAKYSDGSEQTIISTNIGLVIENSDIANKTEPDKDSAVQTVGLAYEGKTVTFNITVLNPITKIGINPDSELKETYKFGESIQYYTLKIDITRLDGSIRTLYAAKLENDVEKITDGFTFNTKKAEYAAEYAPNGVRTNLDEDTVTVVVYYGNKETSFDITVENDVRKIDIVQLPEKLVYNYNDALLLNDMIVNATYLDGTVVEDVNYICTVTALTEVGVQTITVEYEGKTTTFSVTVLNPVTMLYLIHGPYRTLYKTGQELLTNGIELRAHYKDGTSKIITSGYTVSNYNSANQVMGKEVALTYSYDGSSRCVTFTVDIFAPSVLITGGPYEMYYKDIVKLGHSIPVRDYQSAVAYDLWISDKGIADIDVNDSSYICGLRRGTVKLRVTGVEIIEKDGQTLAFDYSECTTIHVKLTFVQWFIKHFILFGWLGFDIYI